MAKTGQSNVTAWVDPAAKRGYEKAARLGTDPQRGVTGLVENIGIQLDRECARVAKLEEYDVQVTLVPAQK